jgi:hypothetical protein
MGLRMVLESRSLLVVESWIRNNRTVGKGVFYLTHASTKQLEEEIFSAVLKSEYCDFESVI